MAHLWHFLAQFLGISKVHLLTRCKLHAIIRKCPFKGIRTLFVDDHRWIEKALKSYFIAPSNRYKEYTNLYLRIYIHGREKEYDRENIQE